MNDRPVPSEAEVRRYLASLSNWGRWGEGRDGLRGTLNLITAADVVAATRLVRSGTVIPCGLPFVYAADGVGMDERGHLVPGSTPFVVHYMLDFENVFAAPPDERVPVMDGFLIQPHGQLITHIEAPAHTLLDGSLYNGVPAGEAITSAGAVVGGVDLVSDGIVGRGVLLDVAAALGVPWLEDRDVVMPEDLERCERVQQVRVGPGDCLCVRTGYRLHKPEGEAKGPGYARPGLQAACLPWLRERDVAVVTSDVAADCWPHGYAVGQPIHAVGQWAIGLWLINNAAMEPLATHCASAGRYEFLFTVGPLNLTAGTASPVNPLAIF